MTEHAYIRSVHRHLPPPPFYRWKINDQFEGGVADAYYCAAAEGQPVRNEYPVDTGLFCEYKYLPRIPKRPSTIIKPMELGSRKCTLQRLWLRDRYYQNKAVVVILGSPQGGVIFTHLAWEDGISTADFYRYLLPNKNIAGIIAQHCRGKKHVYQDNACFQTPPHGLRTGNGTTAETCLAAS